MFAKGTVQTGAIDFGTVRAGTSAAVQRTLTVANESSVIIDNGTAYTTRDRIRATLGTLPAAISSSCDYFDLMSVGRSSSNTLSMATDLPGIVSGNIAVNFASTAAIGSPFFAVEGGTVAVTGIVTQVANFTLGSSGAGQLTSTDAAIYSGLYGGTYLLDFGNVVAGTSVVSRLSVFNTLAASAFAENLGGSFAGPFDFDGFSGAGSYFSDIAGGTRGGFNTVGFDAAGQSLGLHSTYFEFYLTSNFRGLDPVFLGLFRIGLQANVIDATVAGVPEPASWSLMIAGFGLVGAAMRRRTARAA